MNSSDESVLGLVDLERVYAALLEYKRRREYANVYIPLERLADLLHVPELWLPDEDLSLPERVEEGALRLAQTYLDRFVARREREAESAHLEPGAPHAFRENMIPYYILRLPSDAEELYQELEVLLGKPRDLYRTQDGRPIPRLHLARHLYSPLLLETTADWAKELSASPAILGKNEDDFVKDLARFWEAHHAEEPYCGWDVHLLRNLPRVGVGFFRESGFFPEFILWIKDREAGHERVQFIEPHGMHHGGVEGNRPKIEALQALSNVVGEQKAFKERGLSLGGCILTTTRLEELPDAGARNWETLARDHNVIRQEGDYIGRLLGGPF